MFCFFWFCQILLFPDTDNDDDDTAIELLLLFTNNLMYKYSDTKLSTTTTTTKPVGKHKIHLNWNKIDVKYEWNAGMCITQSICWPQKKKWKKYNNISYLNKLTRVFYWPSLCADVSFKKKKKTFCAKSIKQPTLTLR